MAYDRETPFNDLPLLPPSKDITEDVDILKKLVSASRALATTNSSIHRLPNPTILINTIALQEAQTSTEIENIFTTEDDLYKAVSDTINEQHTKPGTKEVLRYREALWEGYRLIVADKGLLDQPVLYLSNYILVNKDEYYYLLGAITQRSSWKPWILYMLDAIEKTAELTNQLIVSIFKQMEKTLAHGKSKIKWYNKEVNELIFSQPYIKPRVIGDSLQVSSRTTLTKYFNELVDAKILSVTKQGKEVFYINDDLIQILKG